MSTRTKIEAWIDQAIKAGFPDTPEQRQALRETAHALEAPIADLIGAARTGDLIILRAADRDQIGDLLDQLSYWRDEHPELDVVVLDPKLNAQVVPADKRTDDERFDAHLGDLQAEAAGAVSDSIAVIDGDIFVPFDVVIKAIAQYTWPTYVSSIGAHALLEDAEQRLRDAGLKPVGEDQEKGEPGA